MGELSRAQTLYEKVWDYASAARVARAQNDLPSLIGFLVELGDLEAARQTCADVRKKSDPALQARAAQICERVGLWLDGAMLAENLGQLERAIELYRKAPALLEVARLQLIVGKLRDAGQTYESLLTHSGSDAAAAHIGLADVLRTFGRQGDAVVHLQRAIALGDAKTTTTATSQLVIELDALGYRQAAAIAFDRLSEEATLDTFLRRPRPSSTRIAGRYSIERLLGSGSMGRVYLAHDDLSARRVALKEAHRPKEGATIPHYERFVREAGIMAALAHPNVVARIEFHQQLGLLALEYMEGGTLRDRLAKPLGPEWVARMAREILSGLEAAHSQGVIHRDVKPPNIFFTDTDVAKLGDFGVAHLQDLGATQTAGFIGTLAYLSPEQISGATITVAADFYSLGATLFEALTGRLPFLGPDFVAQHLGEVAPSPSSIIPSLKKWDVPIARALQKDPQKRFSSASEFLQALPTS